MIPSACMSSTESSSINRTNLFLDDVRCIYAMCEPHRPKSMDSELVMLDCTTRYKAGVQTMRGILFSTWMFSIVL
jgi:hypothetical protein